MRLDQTECTLFEGKKDAEALIRESNITGFQELKDKKKISQQHSWPKRSVSKLEWTLPLNDLRLYSRTFKSKIEILYFL